MNDYQVFVDDPKFIVVDHKYLGEFEGMSWYQPVYLEDIEEAL